MRALWISALCSFLSLADGERFPSQKVSDDLDLQSDGVDTSSINEDESVSTPGSDDEPQSDEVITSSFSAIGQAVIDLLKHTWPIDSLHDEYKEAGINTKMWNYRLDGVLEEDWLWATPLNQIGKPAQELIVTEVCSANASSDEGGGSCDSDFNLVRCESEEDCKRGQCKEVSATRKSEESTATQLCVGHSDDLYDRMFDIMVQAKEFLDIATLSAMTGRFLAAFRNAITHLHNSGSEITIRILMSPLASSVEDVLKDLTRDITPETKLKIYACFWRKKAWWNHAKIIAVDGKQLFQGGHNLWDDHYLRASPVSDVSMHVKGSVTRDAHEFLNTRWNTLWSEKREAGEWAILSGDLGEVVGVDSTVVDTYPNELVDETEAPQFRDADSTDSRAGNGVPIISVGRIGGLNDEAYELGTVIENITGGEIKGFRGGAADDALEKMFESARKSIKCSLQDLGDISGKLWSKYLKAFSKAIWNGAEAYFILSEPNARPDKVSKTDGNYGNGATVDDVRDEVRKALLETKSNYATDRWVEKVLRERVHAATLRFSDDVWLVQDNHSWTDGIPIIDDIGDAFSGEDAHRRYANHAKLYIVDDQMFYIGSQNLYPADLVEYGLIVDDPGTTNTLLTKYWDPLWSSSSQTKAPE